MALRPILFLALLCLAGLAGCTGAVDDGDGPGGGDAAETPDPLVAGQHAVTRFEYDFGYFVVDDPTLVAYRYPVPMHGSLHLPDGDDPAPVVLLMHGRHGTCDYAGQLEFLGAACPDAPPVTTPVDSYTGYDGLAGLLASHGYAVASIDANTINDRDLAGDSGANARGALVLRTLDELAAVNATGGPSGSLALSGLDVTLPANAGVAELPEAQGRLDLGRVGLMGHSRGGEGVARAVSLDLERHGGAHGIDAVFALAPTDFARWPLPGVAFATLLPYCDGDVFNLQGAWMYDDARRLAPVAPRHQVLAMGANHNFYNTVWTGDDWGTTGPWCGSDEKDTGRDTPEQQRAHGDGLMSSFFRLYVGNETAMAPLWDGADSVFPASMCPDRPSCDGRLHASAMPVLMMDLAPEGTPAVQIDLEPDACAGASCPAQPMISTAAQATWNCRGGGYASFDVPGGLEGWRSVSLRVGNQEPTDHAIRVWVTGNGLGAIPALSTIPEDGEQPFARRPGSEDDAAGAKTVLNEVRFALPQEADLSGTTRFSIACSGEGSIQVADILLV